MNRAIHIEDNLFSSSCEEWGQYEIWLVLGAIFCVGKMDYSSDATGVTACVKIADTQDVLSMFCHRVGMPATNGVQQLLAVQL